MATVQEKALCILWFHESKSVETVKRHFLLEYSKLHAFSKDSIKRWYQQFKNTGSVGNRKAPYRLSTPTEDVSSLRETLMRISMQRLVVPRSPDIIPDDFFF
ncbi:hypothetical protein NPIL_586211 [Nephila pilipes]|uniref:DUF4817 domain-containing protein n=1 Tax=Nephila pilipes TaxID=299642 RepID=A0A8X6I3K1_NEPPI|nr:hypothetical protein NPIL_586211 [Nephila pilipes]